MTDRRRFLIAGTAALAASGCTTARHRIEPGDARDLTAARHADAYLPWLEVSVSALRHNVAEITRHAKVPLCACLKAGGYGLGEVNVARAIDDMPELWGYMVVRPEEAFALADANLQKRILLLAPVDEDTAIEATRRGIQLTVTGSDAAAKFERVSRRAGRIVPVHVDVDTGINRQGVRHAQYVRRLRELVASGAVSIEGVASYFITPPDITSTGPFAADLEQIRRFDAMLNDAGATGLPIGMRHMVTTISFFQYPEAYYDMIRCGALLYGGYPSTAARSQGWVDLRLTYGLKCRLAQITSVSAGETVGYGEKNRITEDTRLGLLMIGSLDGYDHRLTDGVTVVNGKPRRVLMRSGSHCVLDLGRDPEARVGDVATLIGTESAEVLANEGGAAWANYYLRPTMRKVVVA